MADSDNDKPVTKSRGASFPTLSLPEAVKVIREAGQYGKQHTPAALAAYAGHQSATSGPWKQKAAALREWGLISTVSADKIALTDRAIRIAHPESSEKAQAALLECFTEATLYMKVYNDLARGVELNITSLSSKAISDYGIGIASKDKFVNSFLESAAAVGLAERIGTDKFKTFAIDGTSAPGQDPVEEPEVRRDPVRVEQPRPNGTPVMSQTWRFNTGELTLSINSTEPLQAKTYTEIAKVVTAIESLLAELGPEESAENDVSQ
ncbi:hypothetical protein [Phytoactinopolyspora limicola]|uniref:hypothetical protein n=1 Tax=Phytoactinopolyspora limicola TaxID=2715536 RepID=UPI0014083104|nr:hypothetical protein [Phytoactinopolyspora limicola]